MKRQKETIGSIVEIDLKNGNYTYAQLLENGTVFFDYLSKEPLKNLEILNNSKILFIVTVYKDVITHGYWLKVGKLPIRKEFEVLPMKFIQDGLDSKIFRLYDPNTGKMLSATKEECKGLERAAVWEADAIENRIKDYYEGNENFYVNEDLKIFKE